MSADEASRRRFLSAGASALLAAGFTGCGETDEDGTTATATASSSSSAATSPPSSAVTPPSSPATDTASTAFTLENEPGEHVDVVGPGGPVARYMYAFDPSRRQETYKTYLHVIDPAAGDLLTSGPTGLYDHHRGIFIGWNELTVDGTSHDFWHFDGGERMVHDSFEGIEAFPSTGTLTSINHWITQADGTVLEETREMAFREPPLDDGIVAIDFTTALTATEEAVVLRGDPEHAGIQYRPHNDVAENESAEYVFPEGTFSDSNPGPGRINDEEGLAWVGQAHTIGGQRYFVQHVNHPDNPPETVYSAYRPYGRFGAFFEAAIPAGESLAVRYRFVIKRGGAPSRDVLQELFEDFARREAA